MPVCYMIDDDRLYHPRPLVGFSGRGKGNLIEALLHRPGQPITEQEFKQFGINVEFDRPAKDGEFLDWLRFNTKHIVSERFVAAVESVDPGRHQFIEVSLLDHHEVLGSRAHMKFFFQTALHIWIALIKSGLSSLTFMPIIRG